MAANTVAVALDPRTHVDEVLSHLPIARTTDYAKGQIIYGRNTLGKSIHLLVAGKVEISQIAEDGSEVLLDVVRPDEFFGESAILDNAQRCERSRAIEKSVLMTWAVSEMESIALQQPRMAMAFLRILAQRNAEFSRRIESFATDTIERRLARALVRFAERLGTGEEDGAVAMMPFTHEMLGRYVGTSREIVTHHMSKFRKQGYISYSRKGIRLYSDAMRAAFGIGAVVSAGASS
jgi:CRP-like cAMP-binding protein